MVQVAIPAVYGLDGDESEVEENGGYVAMVAGVVYEKVKPRWSALQREKIERAGRPADDNALHRMLHGFPADWANSFMRHNKLIGTDRNMGEFVPRVPVARHAGEDFKEVELDAYNVIDGYRDDKWTKKKSDVVSIPKYFLHQVFSDVSVAEKLFLDAGMMIAISRIAVGDPRAACDVVVRHARENGYNVSVRVGDYATGRKASRQRILDASADLTMEPYTCEIIGGNVAVRGISATGPMSSWTITAKLWQMPEVDAVYRLASKKGVAIVNTLFMSDMIKLGVELIADGEDYGFDVQMHIGEYDGTIPGNRVSVYGPDVVRTSSGVFPVVHDGKVVATALYAGDRQVFVNWHVVSGLHASMRDSGEVVSVQLDPHEDKLSALSLLSEVTSDVWLAELADVGDRFPTGLQPPSCRAAIPGEEVIAIYAVPTGVECTDPVYVANYDMGTVCMPRFAQARFGMSGAALVALEDGALLGSYTGSNRTYSLGSSLHVRDNPGWLDTLVAPIVAPHAFASGKGAGAVYQDLKLRGLGDDIAGVSNAIKPLFSMGRRVGNQYLHRHGGVTVLNPEVWDLVDDSGVSQQFASTCEGGTRPLSPGDVAGPYSRPPLLGEKVFAVFRDEKGIVFSDLLNIAWTSPDGVKCRLDGVPQFEGTLLKGAVLVGLGDCAVLGMVTKVDEASWGPYSECVTWSGYFASGATHSGLAVKQGLFERLAVRFEHLKTSTWADDDIRAVVVGDSSAAGSYSRLGVAATLATVLGCFSQQDVQDVEKLVASKLGDDTWMLGLCEKVLPGRDKLFGESCADKINTLRVFLGLVYLREGSSGLSYVLDELGLLQISGYQDSGG